MSEDSTFEIFTFLNFYIKLNYIISPELFEKFLVDVATYRFNFFVNLDFCSMHKFSLISL